tara:strand:- start:7876 stop:8742 length:867 start_codon:yes stop_codon:yes gene_type:complete
MINYLNFLKRMNKFKKEIKQANDFRFYRYEDFRDRLFLLLANPLAYFLYKIKIKANTVSLASGFVAILGGIFLTSQDKIIIFFGSLCFPIFYLLDYVDGIVARLNKKSSVGGQYLDLVMHQVVGITISMGIFVGALKSEGEFIIPFGILSVIASSFFLSRFSIGWFAIIMKFFENKIKSNNEVITSKYEKRKKVIISLLCRLGAFIFHEDYAIFTLPLIFFLNLFLFKYIVFDIRAILTIFGALVLFPGIILDIIYYANNKIDSNLKNIYDENLTPKLPEILYFKNLN